MSAAASLEVLVRFVSRLRREGIPVPAGTTAEVLRAIDVVGLAAPGDVFYALRAVCCTDANQYQVFARVFMAFFREEAVPVILNVSPKSRSWSVKTPGEGTPEGAEGEESRLRTTGASAIERLRQRDFATLTAKEVAEIRALIDSMVWAPAQARSRRQRPALHRGRPDLRRSLHRTVGPEADLMKLEFVERKRRRRPLIIIADVSGSMERYTEMLLYFAHAARGRLGRLEAFVFATHLTRITRQLERRDPSLAITEVAGTVSDWSSGTRIGEAIASFNRNWSRRVGRGGPVAVIISDGWDRGDPVLLATEMARLHRSVHRVIWLNPLAGRPAYAPLTRGMKAALPYVDDFLPVTNFSNLETVVAVLESISSHTRPVPQVAIHD
ncbi:MAG TPA: VWA domain-containing protein [Acidimicrobiia bacterium]|nr:VWA domain-containing protein [Acidimicrobiia bacterium]